MLQRIIDFSLKNKFIVLLATVALVLGGIYSVKNIPLDAIQIGRASCRERV